MLRPMEIGQFIGAWRFDEAAQSIDALAAALDSYAAARALVAVPRNAWNEIGLFGKDPDAALSAAAVDLALVGSGFVALASVFSMANHAFVVRTAASIATRGPGRNVMLRSRRAGAGAGRRPRETWSR